MEIRIRHRRVLPALFLAATLGLGCGSEPEVPEAPPSFVVLSIDGLRPDHLGIHGYHRPTPSIDALARSGVTFGNSYSQATWTLPSVASLFLSQFVSTHQVEHPDLAIPAEVPTVAEILRDHGYRTGAFVMGTYTAAEYGMNRGFSTFETGLGTMPHRNQRFLEWLGEAEGPFFAYLHYPDVHHPYVTRLEDVESYGADYSGPVDGQRRLGELLRSGDLDSRGVRHLRDLYDDAVRFADHHLGELIRALPAAAGGSVVFLTADHGEAFLEHPESLGHRGWPWEPVIRVPLIVAGDAVTAPGLREDLVQAVDIAPTLLELAGIEVPSTMQGRSLLPALEGRDLEARPVLSEATFWSVAAIRDPEWKLIYDFRTRSPQLFRISEDPGESTEVSSEHPETTQRLLKAVASQIRANREIGTEPSAAAEWSETTRKQLEALGYL